MGKPFGLSAFGKIGGISSTIIIATYIEGLNIFFYFSI